MGNFSYRIRGYRTSDFDALIAFLREMAALEPPEGDFTWESIRERLDLAGCSHEGNLFFVEGDGVLIGCLEIVPEVEIGRAVINLVIHPDKRSQALFSRLLECAAARAREIGAGAMHIEVDEKDAAIRTALSSCGFSVIRRHLGMVRDLSSEICLKPGIEFRHLRRGEEAMLAGLQNASFCGSWGYKPNTASEITRFLGLTGASPRDVILAVSGGNPVGYCWVKNGFYGSPGKRGRIFMLGVHPECRERGVGKGLLAKGLAELKKRGFKIAVLSVDAGNSSALSLYRSLGFRKRAVRLWYGKELTWCHTG